MDEFTEKVDSLKTLEIKELGDFMYDIIIRSDALGRVERQETFVLWKKLVVAKFQGVAREKWEQKNISTFTNFVQFYAWMAKEFDVSRCYGYWSDLIKNWKPPSNLKWKDLLITFNRYVQQFEMFENFAKLEEIPYHSIPTDRFGSIIFHAVMSKESKLTPKRKKEMQDYIIDNYLDVNKMTKKTFEEKILNVLIKREAKKLN